MSTRRSTQVLWLGITLMALSAVPTWAQDQLIARGAVWKYLDDGSSQGTGWRQPAFDDSLWASGPAELGYGDGDEATVLGFGPDDDAKYTTTYFRHEFDVVDPSIWQSMVVKILADDGAVAYLNGSEIARHNMPGGLIGSTTFAASTHSEAEEHTFAPFNVSPLFLNVGTNVLAVEIHQRSLTSSDISFNLELLASADEIVTRGPYLQLGTDDRVTVRWRTNLPTNSRVWYGTTQGSLTQTEDFLIPSIDHIVTLTGLQPDTRYWYAIGKTTQELVGNDADHFFETAPTPGTPAPTRIWVTGDSGTANEDAAAVRDAYQAFVADEYADVWLMLGDNAYPEGTDFQYQGGVFDTYPDTLRQSVLWPTRGNHEDFLSVYTGIFTMPAAGEAGGVPSGTESYYSFDHANIHFVCLDSEGSSSAPGSPMRVWLESDLLANDKDWTIAFWHHPPYSKGSHDSDTETDLILMRQNIVPLLEDHGVDLVLCGHSHLYERSFLIDGHYGNSDSFNASMQVNGGDGNLDGDGAYVKVMAPHSGAVYCVAGSSGKLGDLDDGTFDHEAMYVTTLVLGSVIIDVEGQQMDVRFLDSAGAVADEFTLINFPDGGLTADRLEVSLAAGGTQVMSLAAGPTYAGELYWLVGSTSGTTPGLPGPPPLPLNPDTYFFFTLSNPNTIVANSLAFLDGAGESLAALSIGPAGDPSLTGLELDHAYVVLDFPGTGQPVFVSNTIPLEFLP